ncbi:hypothetical protein QQS21_003304 [Conoideocrella luteorostrata]|uniref:Microbial-type PARG catalytic domain-containing protein n=1 Tax=Conoideocrella luteorostrata TaxID=1105319 RepID=A0AAJ0CTK2_9HYPO|nr:hypothetical protein QQS21_003304 [Conoideocrella luteorostrata]
MAIPPRIARARRDARAKNAKAFINKTVPAILKSNARARRGVETAHLVVDPPRSQGPQKQQPHQRKNSDLQPRTPAQYAADALSPAVQVRPPPSPMRITLHIGDTLEAAYLLSRPSSSRVVVLNMASPLRPGGGVLTGATSQEEWLCARTTLYPSLREEFYRLPDVGGVYTPDVLVLRGWDAQARDLPREKRFFVDVITSAMLRMPDVEGGQYAEERDKEMVVRKMRGVMRMARDRGAMKLVLGAWGCGAYGNPPDSVARAWKKVLCGKGRRKTDDGEGWDGLEVVFAIKDRRMAEVFARAFGEDMKREADDEDGEVQVQGAAGVDQADEDEESDYFSEEGLD